MKSLTPQEILSQEAPDSHHIRWNEAIRAMERLRDQDVTVLRHLFQQKLSDATDLALREGMKVGRREILDYGKKLNYD